MSRELVLTVLAAGIGSRYGGLKQLDPVGPSGEVILDYSVYDAMRAGFTRVVFVIRHEFETAFRDGILSRYPDRVPVTLAYQALDMLPAGFALPKDRRKPWGTSHAVLCARDAIGDAPFAVINADDFYGAGAYQLLKEFLLDPSNDGRTYALVGYRLRNTLSEHGAVARGVCRVDAAGNLIESEELTAIELLPDGRIQNRNPDGTVRVLSGDEPVSMNFWGFFPSIFEPLEAEFTRFLHKHGHDPKAEYYLPPAITAIIRSGRARCRVLPTSEQWFGVTYREDKPRVVESIRKLVAAGVYPERLWP